MKLSKLLFLLLLTTLTACTLPVVPEAPVVDPGATLHLYLQPLPQEARALTLTISALDARTADGRDVPLLNEPLRLSTAELPDRQVKLATVNLPVGQYQGLLLAISRATLETDEGGIDLLIDPQQQLLEENFRIDRDQATTLFLELRSERLVIGGYLLGARFSLWKAQPPLPELKGLASHPQTGTLTLFEKTTPAVISVRVAGNRPTGLALDQEARNVYLALTGEDSIARFDLVQERVARKLRLRPGDAPEELALSADRQTLVVTNPGSSSVSLVDTASLTERQRQQFTTRPASVFTGSRNDRAYVLLPEANALAVIDLDRGTLRARADFPETPLRGRVAGDGQSLYLLTEDAPDLLIVDAESLTVDSRIFIGYGATCLAVNPAGGMVYVGRDSGEVAIVDPQVGLPIDSIRVGEPVIAIVPDREENSLFVATGTSRQVRKYDLVSKRLLATLEPDAASYQLAVMGED